MACIFGTCDNNHPPSLWEFVFFVIVAFVIINESVVTLVSKA